VARAYQRCVKALREELDIGPAPETEDLYQALKV
jgi:DNA-binding SARP family transcriptional activator